MAIFKRKKKDSSDEVASKKETSTKKKKVVKEKKSASVKLGVQCSELMIKPLITEKSATLASSNQYVFVVSRGANRVQIRSAIRSMYGITPVSVNIQNVRGKRVRFGRVRGKRKDWKKAIVTLPEGKTINVYDGV